MRTIASTLFAPLAIMSQRVGETGWAITYVGKDRKGPVLLIDIGGEIKRIPTPPFARRLKARPTSTTGAVSAPSRT